MVGKIERLRLRMLEKTHAPLAQRPRQSNEKFARTKAAAEAVDHATHIKSLGGAIPSLQLPCGKDFEKRRPALVGHWHQRTQIAPFHELVGGFEARHVGLSQRRRAGAVLHGGAQVVVAIKRFETLASLHGAPQECPHPPLRLSLRLIAVEAPFHVLLGQLRNHDVHGLRPSGQELARIESGCSLFAVDAFFDHDDVEPTSDRRFRRAEPGEATARDQKIACQILIRGGRGRKIPDFLVIR